MEDLPEFEFSDEIENEFAQMNARGAISGQSTDGSAGAGQETPGTANGAISEGTSGAAAADADRETQFYAWQICLADMATNALTNADDFPSYLVNREPITQMLGIGMASGQNAFPLEDQMFVVAISVQDSGQIKLIGPDYPRYRDIAAVVSEELLKGLDRGMVAELPNGKLIAVKSPVDPSKL